MNDIYSEDIENLKNAIESFCANLMSALPLYVMPLRKSSKYMDLFSEIILIQSFFKQLRRKSDTLLCTEKSAERGKRTLQEQKKNFGR